MGKNASKIYDYLVKQAHAPQAFGVISKSVPEMASAVGISPRTVDNALRDLKKDGLVLERKHRLTRIKLPNSNGRREDLRGADFSGQNLRGVDWNGEDLSGANLKGADLAGARLAHTQLTNACFDDANLKDAFMRGAQLFNASFCGASLRGTSLRKAQFHSTSFQDATLHDVDAYGSSAFNVDFKNASIRDLSVGAPLMPGSLWKAIAVSEVQIVGINGFAHMHSLLGQLLDFTMCGNTNTPFVGGYIEAERYGCWEEGHARIARNYPDFFVEWIRRWRQPDVDSNTRIFSELALEQLCRCLDGGCAADSWEELMRFRAIMPRQWHTYVAIRYRRSAGRKVRSGSVMNHSELSFYDILPTAVWPSDEDAAQKILSLYSEKEWHGIRRTIDRARPLSTSQIASLMHQIDMRVDSEITEDAGQERADAAG